MKKPHPWEDLINPSKPVPVPLADAHHAQSVLGKGGSKKQKKLPKMIAKGKFKGPRPIIEADDDEIYSGSNSSIVNKKGKQKKNGKTNCIHLIFDRSLLQSFLTNCLV